MNNLPEYEYKAQVKKKVKDIESRLSCSGTNEQEVRIVNNDANKPRRSISVQNEPTITSKTSVGGDVRIISKSTSLDPDPHAIAPPLAIAGEANKKVSPEKFVSVPQQQIRTKQSRTSEDHLNKQSKPIIHVNPRSIKLTNMELNNSISNAPIATSVAVPTPVPRNLSHVQSFHALDNAVKLPTDRLITSAISTASGSSTRRSSEDDGIADMALESDLFDDSTMPLPKIKDNAFFVKDKVRPSDLLLTAPRRASLIPQSSYDKEGQKPKTSRTRTDSTNSAENFVIQKFASDLDLNRRESQSEIQVDLLQSGGLRQLGSPIGSPVVVRSKTLSNSTASILVLGLPFSGKSATIDSLVQQRVAESRRNPPEIVEYTAKIKILDSSNLFNLKIIESPGFSNDPTISSDASLMSTLVSYMESKDGLRGKPPTIVLVVLRFDDNRLWHPEDEHPDIVNFLKLIHNFQHHFNNNKYANFVFVLTHFLDGTLSEQEQRKPQSKIVELINLIQKYTSLPHPIMVACAENEQEAESKPSKRSNLVIASADNHPDTASTMTVTLPNGETYPYNLIEKIKQLLTKKGQDSVGETVLRTAFGIEYPYSIKECSVTQRIPLIPVSHPSVQQMQKTLLQAYMDIERTEIFTLLEIGWENIDKPIRDKFPDSLYTVQQIFQTKKVRQFKDIPTDPVQILNLVRQMPSNLAVKDLLIDTLQLKVPAFYPASYIGQGVDLGKDSVTNVSPFLLTSGLKTSPAGLIPNEFRCKIRDDREICFKFFYDTEEYVLGRLKDMNLNYSISPNSLPALSASSTGQRRGYNIIKRNQEPTKSTVATAVIEYRMFQLTLQQNEQLKLKPQFWDTVKDLPDLDVKDKKSVSAWQEFFGYWGTHVVTSAFAGGSVEITFRGSVLTKIFNSMEKDFIMPSDEYETTRVFQWITGDGLDFVARGKDIRSDFLHGYDVEARFHGGDIRFQQVDITKVESKELAADIREEWKESLILNPVMLETNLILEPISNFVRPVSEGVATKIDVALHYFYSDFMVTKGKPSSCRIL